ncbi:hypothetical protein AGABI1DRAFT_114117 [Agaricus bisporus var. burnettii JB137-S8]|uniref:Uncharacterized protein n=1 Tax=Agaricus bisporus var. burnettii (strain JB137-S8 / ATCC MYA-4627 / FGSC 10392) TaxID=597362 RepID=K5VYQ0_AGABU|nr:uncharacterized protein AGABI1DRAFT_114117 [Agaricus bisporus var. burnettii JB137-S8]EKM79589.1 hypothetical protein AGABI1DRAFT_114117 [Agaricus bisporus var. burnettii JB137-S8]
MKKAIRRVIDANDDDLKNNPKGFLCDLDTIQVIMELFQTISESGRLIRESRDYYRMLQTLSADDKLNLPSKGEITLMRERWFAFSRGIGLITPRIFSQLKDASATG